MHYVILTLSIFHCENMTFLLLYLHLVCTDAWELGSTRFHFSQLYQYYSIPSHPIRYHLSPLYFIVCVLQPMCSVCMISSLLTTTNAIRIDPIERSVTCLKSHETLCDTTLRYVMLCYVMLCYIIQSYVCRVDDKDNLEGPGTGVGTGIGIGIGGLPKGTVDRMTTLVLNHLHVTSPHIGAVIRYICVVRSYVGRDKMLDKATHCSVKESYQCMCRDVT